MLIGLRSSITEGTHEYQSQSKAVFRLDLILRIRLLIMSIIITIMTMGAIITRSPVSLGSPAPRAKCWGATAK